MQRPPPPRKSFTNPKKDFDVQEKIEGARREDAKRQKQMADVVLSKEFGTYK